MVKYENDLRRQLEALKQRAEGVFKGRKSIPYRGMGRSTPSTERPPEGDGGRRGRRIRMGAEPSVRLSGPLERLIPGESFDFGGWTFYRVLTDAETVWEDAGTFHRDYLETLASPFPPEFEELVPLKVLQEVSPEEICYLDLETTGLAMVPLFLVGLMYTSNDRLVLDQLFARDYTEESSVLRFTQDFLKRFRVVVTFNGITFDLPFLGQRMTYSGIEFVTPEIHLDLLPLARGLLRGRTPNHRLQTLERYLCNRKRIGDVPGSEIPGVYHEFVRSGDAGDLTGVFHHNRLDLLTMLQLATVFLSGRYRV